VISRIYYTDPYCRRFDATVRTAFVHDGRPAVLLDRTAFYPTSGGQPFDTGHLYTASTAADDPRTQSTDVVETIEVNDDVVHLLSSPLSTGMAVQGEIDWTRRFDHMQQHTGQHVLSAAFDRLFSNRTTSFHMGPDAATIDLARELSWEEIERAEDEANRIIWEDRGVSIRFVSPDMVKAGAAIVLRKESSREGVLRLIDVTDFDVSACGGTHVSRTGAIGVVVVSAAEKFRGGTRLTFACGNRALRTFRGLRAAVSGSVRVLSVLPEELPAAINRLQGESKELRRSIRKFQEALAEHEAERLAASGALMASHGGSVIVEVLDEWDSNGLKAIALAVTARTRAAVALFSASQPHAVVIARSPGIPVDAHAVLRALIERFGGRGGGKPDLAQGGGLSGDLADLHASARHLLIADPS